MSLGVYDGGCIQLSTAGSSLALTEGVETGLSILQELSVPVWAVLGAKNFKGTKLPELPLASKVSLFADGDEDSLDAVASIGEMLIHEGRKVFAIPAPEGLDWNDVLQWQKGGHKWGG